MLFLYSKVKKKVINERVRVHIVYLLEYVINDAYTITVDKLLGVYTR